VGDTWKSATSDQKIQVNGLGVLLKKYQDPTEADKVLKVRKELDEIKAICVQTIDQLLRHEGVC